MINVNVEYKEGINKVEVNDLFKIDDIWFILVNTPNGYSISSLESPEYLNSENKLESYKDVIEFLALVKTENKVVHYPCAQYKMTLKVVNKY